MSQAHDTQFLENELCQLFAMDLAKSPESEQISLGGADITIGNIDGTKVIVVAPMDGQGIVLRVAKP